MENNVYDVIVIGGGPAGLASANKCHDNKKKVLLIEREEKLGGILKQCIHDGFGLKRYNEKLSGPEYAYKEISKIKEKQIEVILDAFVSKIEKENDFFILHVVTSKGVIIKKSKKLIFATGCRERTSKQIQIMGTNPSGVMNAGQAQFYINKLGKMPGKEFVILGSGDIGLIMARRITLEGGKVLGVYEAKSEPSGLSRNIVQCLNDFNIPLHLSTTVTKVFGKNRLSAIEISKVNEKMEPIKGSEEIIKCDTLILSVGLIPENELISTLGVKISPLTKGPQIDQDFLTNIDNVYVSGNEVHVNDLVDYVSESGEIAGNSASSDEVINRKNIKINIDKNLLYVVPELINLNSNLENVTLFFRSKRNFKNKKLKIFADNKEIFNKRYLSLKPPEMEKIIVSFDKDIKEIKMTLED